MTLPLLIALTPLLGTGCAPHSVRRVEALAAVADTDPHAVDKLVKALRVQDEAVWHLAYAELLSLGPKAAPALRDSVRKKKPEAGRALLLLAEMGDPAHFDLIAAAERVPSLSAYAEQAWVLAEAHLYERIVADPDLALCDAYLEHFGNGPGARHVEQLRFEQEAWLELKALGPQASVKELVAFIKRWRGTEADRQAREWVALKGVQQANQLIDAGRPQEALARLADAQRWDPDVDTRAAEGRAREALGRDLASREDLSAAISELEAARALGADNANLLGSLYLERARARFLAQDPVGGMSDLALARERQPAVSQAADAIADQQAKQLLAEVAGRGAGRSEAVRALAWSKGHREALDSLVLDSLAAGDAVPIEALAASSQELDADGRRANNAVIDQALQNSRSRALARLGPGSVEPLLAPEHPWSRDAELERQEALSELVAFEVAVRLAKGEVASGRRILAPLPQEAVLSEVDLQRLAERGGDPRAAALPPLHRAQLLRWALEAGVLVLEQARSNPAPLAGALLQSERLPEDLLQWRQLVERGRVGGQVPLNNTRASAYASRQGDVLDISFRLSGPVASLSDAAVGDLLTVLFGLAPVCMLGDLSLRGLRVSVQDASGAKVGHVALDRRSFERMNWPLIVSEAPFTADHAMFLFDVDLP